MLKMLLKGIFGLWCSSVALNAAPPGNARPFYIRCGSISVRIMPSKSWTPDIIKRDGKIIAQQNGFSGLVAEIKGRNLWIGSGHSEGGRERVVSFKLFIDGKPAKIPVTGESIKCIRAETVKESFLDDLKLTSKLIITPDQIKGIHDLTAEKAMNVKRLYGFLHCWSNKTTDWMYKPVNGTVKSGKFVSDGSFKLFGDVRWVASFDPTTGTVIYTEFPADLPPGEGRKHCIWDIKNYHKQYYQAMAKKSLKKGDKFHYEMTIKLFAADKRNWHQVVKAAANGKSAATSIQPDNPDFFYVNLRKAVNMGFADEKADDRRGGWTDQGPNNDLSALSSGKKKFNGIPFDIINPDADNGKSCIVLRNKYKPYFPLESKPVAINRKAQLLYLLTACAWSGKYGKNIAHVIVRYKDSSFYSEIPMTYGTHLSGWWNPQPVKVGKVAWKTSNGSSDVGFYSFGWVNPYLEKEIKDIQLVSANKGGMPILLAVTGVKHSAIAKKLVKETKSREYKAATKSVPPKQVKVTIDFNRKLDHQPAYSVAFGIGGNCISPLYRKAAVNIMQAGTGTVLFRYQVSTTVGKAEPALAEGVWNFKNLDRIVNYIKDLGAEPMLCFGPGGPIWMGMKNNVYGDSKRYWRPASISEYTDYCRKIAARYHAKGIPIKWEIGNEVELKRWPASYYVKVYGSVAKAIKNVSTTLVTGGPATCNPNLGWAGEMIDKYPALVDFVSYHEYGYSETFDSPDDFIMAKTVKYESSAKDYRELMKRKLPGRKIPLIVTEANINWRWQGGVDPRIRNMAGAAWFASAQGRFWRGGGDALCYFTFGGGFGSCYKSGKEQLTLNPAYHAIWLFRKLGHGKMTSAVTSNDTVEAYAFVNDSGKNLIIVNKNKTPVTVSLKSIFSNKQAIQYILNNRTYSTIKYLTASKNAPQLKPDTVRFPEIIQFKMQPFEVRGVTTK
jgi:glycosyl hydrolase family 39 (putative alpha-L-iduronidase)